MPNGLVDFEVLAHACCLHFSVCHLNEYVVYELVCRWFFVVICVGCCSATNVCGGLNSLGLLCPARFWVRV